MRIIATWSILLTSAWTLFAAQAAAVPPIETCIGYAEAQAALPSINESAAAVIRVRHARSALAEQSSVLAEQATSVAAQAAALADVLGPHAVTLTRSTATLGGRYAVFANKTTALAEGSSAARAIEADWRAVLSHVELATAEWRVAAEDAGLAFAMWTFHLEESALVNTKLADLEIGLVPAKIRAAIAEMTTAIVGAEVAILDLTGALAHEGALHEHPNTIRGQAYRGPRSENPTIMQRLIARQNEQCQNLYPKLFER